MPGAPGRFHRSGLDREQLSGGLFPSGQLRLFLIAAAGELVPQLAGTTATTPAGLSSAAALESLPGEPWQTLCIDNRFTVLGRRFLAFVPN